MKYISTRGGVAPVSASHAILQGIAEDGGLYVPERFPALNADWEAWASLSYREIALIVLKPFLPEFGEEELADLLALAYDGPFEHEHVAPLVRVGDVHFLELFYGRTAAFKDMALSFMPHLLTSSVRKQREDKRIAILAATSGDTGIAALRGFQDVPGTDVIVFFPEEGVSPVQKQQMRTAEGNNTHVIGIEGNFDDAQRGVKQILNDADFIARAHAKGVRLTAANSINIGRLLPQVVYYVWTYAQLVSDGALRAGDPMNIVVPSGNFGNLLAGYYAWRMGVPMQRRICASNENRVLADFFESGTYDARRPLYITSAPSMDILVSSNLERLLYHLSEEDGALVAGWMQALQTDGVYRVDGQVLEGLSLFDGGYADEGAIEAAIERVYREHGYVMDTHTAAAYVVYRAAVAQDEQAPSVILSTASPYKFAGSVSRALGLDTGADEFAAIDRLAEESGLAIPGGLAGLQHRPIRHRRTIAPSDMAAAVSSLLQ